MFTILSKIWGLIVASVRIIVRWFNWICFILLTEYNFNSLFKIWVRLWHVFTARLGNFLFGGIIGFETAIDVFKTLGK